ncbi:MAG TPA: permease-like cell division protein FtsX [Chloroflexota bacterium]|nr:permease-like cell division protein FtsX [Chloroflexota bacterium]
MTAAITRFFEVVRYAVSTAAVNFWRHRAMSLAAVFAAAVMMLMLNGFVIVVSNLNVALGALEQKVNVIAYLRDDAPAAEVTRMQERLRANPLVAEVSYLTKDDAMARLKQQLADRRDLLEMVTGNPLPASVEVRLKDANRIADLAAQLRKESAVEDVTLQQDVVDNLLRITNFARVAGVVMVAGLIGITLFVIVNTIRLAVYARRQEIEIMKLVGATDWFIRWPFVLEGVICGLSGALLTSALVGAAYEPMQVQFLSLVQFLPVNLDADFPLRLAGLTAAVGIAIGAAGSYISVRRFLDV